MRWAGSGMNWAAQEHAQERNMSSRAMDSMRALTLGLMGLLKTGRGFGAGWDGSGQTGSSEPAGPSGFSWFDRSTVYRVEEAWSTKETAGPARCSQDAERRGTWPGGDHR